MWHWLCLDGALVVVSRSISQGVMGEIGANYESFACSTTSFALVPSIFARDFDLCSLHVGFLELLEDSLEKVEIQVMLESNILKCFVRR